MQRLALIVQGDETFSSRQRVVVNPVRFRSVQELKEVLSSELNYSDGTPMVLPPSAVIELLDPAVGKYVPLTDVKQLCNNSRLRVIRDGHEVPMASSALGVVTTSSHPLARTSAISAFYSDPAMVEATVRELLVYHAQVVALLSAHIRPERDITAQDIQASCEGPQAESTRHVVEDMWKQKNVTVVGKGGPGLLASAMSQARVVSQFALQRGATEREASEGDAAERLKETVSVYQRRVERLENALKEVTEQLDATDKLLVVASQEKEATTAGLEARIRDLTRENMVLQETASHLTATVRHLEKELTCAVESRQRTVLDDISGVDPAAAHTRNSIAARMEDSDFLPTTAQEERYLDMIHHPPTSQIARPQTAPVSLPTALVARAQSTTTGVPSLFRGLAGSVSMSSSGLTSPTGSSPLRMKLTVLVRYLPANSLGARQESISITDVTCCTNLDRFTGLLRDRCGFNSRSKLEISFMENGMRRMLVTLGDLTRFVELAKENTPLPGAARGPAPMSLGVIEFDPSSTTSSGGNDPGAGTLTPQRSRSPKLCTFEGVNEPSPLAIGDDSTAADSSFARTPAQKARLAAAVFLGKQIDPDDLVKRETLENSASQLGFPVGSSTMSPKHSAAAASVAAPRSKAATSSKLMSSVLTKLKRSSVVAAQNAAGFAQDGLSTRNLFLHAATVTVPTDDEMKSMFTSLARGHTTIDRHTLVEHLIKKYDDVGDRNKFYRLLGLPVSDIGGVHRTPAVARNCGGVSLEEFCMVMYRLVRE